MSIIEIYDIKNNDELQYIEYDHDDVYICFSTEQLIYDWFVNINIYLQNDVMFYGLTVRNEFDNEYEHVLNLRLNLNPDNNKQYWILNCSSNSINLVYKLFCISPNTEINLIYIWTIDAVLNIIDYKRTIRNKISTISKIDKIIITDYYYDELGIAKNCLIDKIKSLMIKK